MSTTLLEEANELLRNVQDELIKIKYRIDINFQLENINQQKANELRITLAQLRQLLDADMNRSQAYDCQRAIHYALIFLAQNFPLNEKTIGNQLICPITLQTFDIYKSVALSNGCYYPMDTIGDYAEGKELFPRLLPGSLIEIDERDVREAQKKTKIEYVNVGLYSGLLSLYVPLFASIILHMTTGISVAGMLYTGLVGLGLTAGLATAATVGVLAVIPLVAALVIGGALGAWYYRKHHPSQLAPSIEHDDVTSSTALAFEELGISAEPTNNKRSCMDVLDTVMEEEEPLVQEFSSSPSLNLDQKGPSPAFS